MVVINKFLKPTIQYHTFFLKQTVSLIIPLHAVMVINSSCCGARELNKLAALNVLVVLPLSFCHFDPNLNCFISLAMIMVMGGRSLKFLFAFLTLLLHLKPALGFSSGVGDDSVRCIERERQALLEFKSNLVDDYGILSSWGSEDEKKNCCNWKGVHCSNQTGHVLELELLNLR